LHRKALRVKSADFAKSGSLFQSFLRFLSVDAFSKISFFLAVSSFSSTIKKKSSRVHGRFLSNTCRLESGRSWCQQWIKHIYLNHHTTSSRMMVARSINWF
ncbi:hypothetical protein, partial [Pseudomonas aeruginosa]|uniref:hypothetical protein n=1 Tax=Pseudomonas aeruginosa TaxID=287 RepID=UPI0026EA2676